MHGTLPRLAARQRLGATVLYHNVVGQPVRAPVQLDRRRRSLSAVVKRHADPRRPHIVSVHRPGDTLRPTDDTVRLRAAWKKTLIGPRDVMLVTYLPAGSGGSSGSSTGKQIGMAVAMIALVAAASFAAPVVAGALLPAGLSYSAFTGATTAINLGLVVGAGYLTSLATRPKADSQDTADRPIYGVSGGGNLPRPGDRIPVPFGRCWHQPDLSQPDYSMYAGEDQILYKRVTHGLGKYQFHKIMLGTATLWTAEGGVQPPFNTVPGGSGSIQGGGTGGADPGPTAVEIIPPGGTSTLVPGSVYSHPSVLGIELPRPGDNPAWSGPWRVAPVGRQASRIQLDYQLPQGVRNNANDGAANWAAVFEYAPCDEDDNPTGDWQPLHANGGTVKSTRAVRFTKICDIDPGDYVVRAQNAFAFTDQITNAVMWDGMRVHYGDAVVRPHVTDIAFRIRSGKGLGITSFADILVEATRILPVWTGTAWEEQPTRKAVYAWADILRADYGGNLADNAVDLERVKYYAENLTEHDTFDGVIRGPVSVVDAANTVLGPMRAETSRNGMQWSIARDEQSAVRRHTFTRREIRSGSSANRLSFACDDGSADVIVEYAPGGDPRKRREVRVTFGPQTLMPRRVQGFGIASYEHAYHYALWRAAVAFYRRDVRTFSADRQGRILRRGQRSLVDAWFMSSARAGGVLARNGLTLTLDTDMVVDGGTHALLRDRLGREWGPVAVSAPDPQSPHVIALDADDVAVVESFYGQTLAEVFLADHERMTPVLVGPLAELQDYYLIRSVQPQGRDVVAIEAVNDAPEVWEALGEAIPPPPPIADGGDESIPGVPVVPWAKAKCVQKGAGLAMEWALGHARGAAAYVVRLSYDNGATYEPVAEGMQTSGSYPLRHEEGVSVQLAAYAVGKNGAVGPTVYASFATFKPKVDADTADLDHLRIKFDQLERDLREYLTVQEDAAQISADLAAEARVAAENAKRDAFTRISQEANDRIAALQAEAAARGAAVTSLQNQITTSNQNLAYRIDAVASDVGTLSETVTGHGIAITALESRVAVTEAGIVAINSAITAVSSRLDNVQQQISGQSNAISQLQATVAIQGQNITSLGQQITVVNARVDNIQGNAAANAEAISLLQARASSIEGVNTAQSSAITQLTAEVSGNSAAISQEATARANQFGQLVGYWAVNANLNGRVSGIRLIAQADGQGQNVSTLIFEVDKVFFAAPGQPATALFRLSPDLTTFGLVGDIIVDGTIYARHIIADAATRLDVYQGDIATVVFDGTEQTIGTLPISSTGRKHTILCAVDVNRDWGNQFATNGQGSEAYGLTKDFTVRMNIDGWQFRLIDCPAHVYGVHTVSHLMGLRTKGHFPILWSGILPAGDHMITLTMQQTPSFGGGGPGFSLTADMMAPTIVNFEARR